MRHPWLFYIHTLMHTHACTPTRTSDTLPEQNGDHFSELAPWSLIPTVFPDVYRHFNAETLFFEKNVQLSNQGTTCKKSISNIHAKNVSAVSDVK